MKKEYESPEIVIEHFNISSAVCGIGSGLGWEEEEIFGFGFGDNKGEETWLCVIGKWLWKLAIYYYLQ